MFAGKPLTRYSSTGPIFRNKVVSEERYFNITDTHLNDIVLLLVFQFLFTNFKDPSLETTFPGHELEHPDTPKYLNKHQLIEIHFTKE
jgi:hypothetical protein